MSETLFAALLGAIAGGIIGAISTYYATRSARSTALDAIRITEFNKAITIFRTAFINEQFLLRQNTINGTKHPKHIVSDTVIIAHEKAKILLEPFLPNSELIGFNEAWEAYKNCEDNYNDKLIKSPESIIENEPNRNKDITQYCLTHLDNLLKYAKPK